MASGYRPPFATRDHFLEVVLANIKILASVVSLYGEGWALLARSTTTAAIRPATIVAASVAPGVRVPPRGMSETIDGYDAESKNENEAHRCQCQGGGPSEAGGEANSVIVLPFLTVAIPVFETLPGVITLDGGVTARPKYPTFAAGKNVLGRKCACHLVLVDPAVRRRTATLALGTHFVIAVLMAIGVLIAPHRRQTHLRLLVF